MRIRLALFVLVLIAVLSDGSDEPRLELSAHVITRMSPAIIRLHAEIKGKINDEWFCPEVVWEMPDGTIAKHLEDCDPEYEGPRTWWRMVPPIEVMETTDVPFTVSLWKSDHMLATKTVKVRIIG